MRQDEDALVRGMCDIVGVASLTDQQSTTSSRTEWYLVGHYWFLTESSQKQGGHSEDLVRIAQGPCILVPN